MNTNDVVVELIAEMKTLRKSRGINVAQVDRIGPTLQTAFGVEPDDGPADIRRKVGGGLGRLARSLPEDLQLVVLAAFGLIPEARQPFYQERARWAGGQLGRDERTVRRRMDQGINQLAELTAAQLAGKPAAADEPPGGRWHTDTLRALLNLDRAAPEAFEFRRIVADQHDLTEIDLAVTLTGTSGDTLPGDPNLAVDVLYGGSLVRRTMETARRFGLALALPRPLDRGEEHEFALRFRVPAGQVMRPHFVCVMKQACDLLEVRVKFDEKRPPAAVWRLTKVFQDDLDDPAHRGDMVPVDSAAELRIEFAHVSPGFAYGVQWDKEDTAEPA
ncbi:MAG TPA: hypothetical protein VEO01_17560 [Pseudonocardiaceae bacterium]|nr:hypothetical protein [Pseudonocardiaceae bacterium]